MYVSRKRIQEGHRVAYRELSVGRDPLHEPDRGGIRGKLRLRIHALIECSTRVDRERVLAFVAHRRFRRVVRRIHDSPTLWERIIVDRSHVTNDELVDRILWSVSIDVLWDAIRILIPEVKHRNFAERIRQRPLAIVTLIETLLPLRLLTRLGKRSEHVLLDTIRVVQV